MDEKKLKNFKDWLNARGAEILPSTNEYELIRWHANGVISVIYINKHGHISSFLNEGEKAYDAFRMSRPYEVNNTTKNNLKKCKKDQRKSAILERDGDACFFCGVAMESNDQTLEHLLSLAHGGSHHVSNLVLAHSLCNTRANHMSISEKIKLREAIRNGEEIK